MSSGNFPKGMRVLVYAQEPTTCHYYRDYLQWIQYKVTATSEENEAMNLLSEHKNRFDIVLMEVKSPSGYIYDSISKIDLPIIIISEDKSVESVTKWMKKGACDYLVKPLRTLDLELIHKNVVRARRSADAGEKVSGEGSSSGRVSKKRRVVWDNYLHQKFCDALNYLGDDAVPKKILEYMNVPYLTRDQVASHLQKHRQNEARKKKEMESTSPKERQEATEMHGERNVQFETPRIDYLSPPFLEQPCNLTPHPMLSSSLGPDLDEAFSVNPSRNVLMIQQHYNPQATDFTIQQSWGDDENIWNTNRDSEMGFLNDGLGVHYNTHTPFDNNVELFPGVS